MPDMAGTVEAENASLGNDGTLSKRNFASKETASAEAAWLRRQRKDTLPSAKRKVSDLEADEQAAVDALEMAENVLKGLSRKADPATRKAWEGKVDKLTKNLAKKRDQLTKAKAFLDKATEQTEREYGIVVTADGKFKVADMPKRSVTVVEADKLPKVLTPAKQQELEDEIKAEQWLTKRDRLDSVEIVEGGEKDTPKHFTKEGGTADVVRDKLLRLLNSYEAFDGLGNLELVVGKTQGKATMWVDVRFPSAIMVNPTLLKKELGQLKDETAERWLEKKLAHELHHLIDVKTAWGYARSRGRQTRGDREAEGGSEELQDVIAYLTSIHDSVMNHAEGREVMAQVAKDYRDAGGPDLIGQRQNFKVPLTLEYLRSLREQKHNGVATEAFAKHLKTSKARGVGRALMDGIDWVRSQWGNGSSKMPLEVQKHFEASQAILVANSEFKGKLRHLANLLPPKQYEIFIKSVEAKVQKGIGMFGRSGLKANEEDVDAAIYDAEPYIRKLAFDSAYKWVVAGLGKSLPKAAKGVNPNKPVSGQITKRSLTKWRDSLEALMAEWETTIDPPFGAKTTKGFVSIGTIALSRAAKYVKDRKNAERNGGGLVGSLDQLTQWNRLHTQMLTEHGALGDVGAAMQAAVDIQAESLAAEDTVQPKGAGLSLRELLEREPFWETDSAMEATVSLPVNIAVTVDSDGQVSEKRIGTLQKKLFVKGRSKESAVIDAVLNRKKPVTMHFSETRRVTLHRDDISNELAGKVFSDWWRSIHGIGWAGRGGKTAAGETGGKIGSGSLDATTPSVLNEMEEIGIKHNLPADQVHAIVVGYVADRLGINGVNQLKDVLVVASPTLDLNSEADLGRALIAFAPTIKIDGDTPQSVWRKAEESIQSVVGHRGEARQSQSKTWDYDYDSISERQVREDTDRIAEVSIVGKGLDELEVFLNGINGHIDGRTPNVQTIMLSSLGSRIVLEAHKHIDSDQAHAYHVMQRAGELVMQVKTDSAQALALQGRINSDLAPLAPVLSFLNVARLNRRKVLGKVYGERFVRNLGDGLKHLAKKAASKLPYKGSALLVAGKLDVSVEEASSQLEQAMRAAIVSGKLHEKTFIEQMKMNDLLRRLDNDTLNDLNEKLYREMHRRRNTLIKSELNAHLAHKTLTKADRDRMNKEMPRIVRWSNLGLLSEDTFYETIAEQYGLPHSGSRLVKELEKLAKEISAPNMNGVGKMKLMSKMKALLDDNTEFDWTEVAADYWYAQILSGTRTWFDVFFFSALNGLIQTMQAAVHAGGKTQSFNEGLKVMSRYFVTLPDAFKEFADILKTGELHRLPDAEERITRSMTDRGGVGEGHLGGSDTLESYRRRHKAGVGGAGSRALGELSYVRRFMIGLDYIGALATREAMVYHGAIISNNHEQLQIANRKFEKAEWKREMMMARDELADQLGVEPSKVKMVDVRARARQRLEEGLPTDLLHSATEQGRIVALNADPVGLLGGFHRMLLGGGTIRHLAGLTFFRPASNLVQNALNYMPVMGYMNYRRTQQTYTAVGAEFRSLINRKLKGHWDLTESVSEQRAQMILANQLTGIGLTALAWAFFLGGDDEEGGDRYIDINGGWRGLTRSQRSQLYSDGQKPYSIRVGSVVFAYQNTMFASVLSIIGAARDVQKYKPEQWDEVSMVGAAADAYAGGLGFAGDVSSLSHLMAALGVSSQSRTRESEAIVGRLLNLTAASATAFVPVLGASLTKEVETYFDDDYYRAETLAEKSVKNLALFRRTGGEGPLLNVLGEPVKIKRHPLSRFVKTAPSDPVWSELGRLARHNVFLPAPTSAKVYGVDGRRKMTSAEDYLYKKEVGRLYRQVLESNLDWLKVMTPEEAARFFDSLGWARSAARSIIQSQAHLAP